MNIEELIKLTNEAKVKPVQIIGMVKIGNKLHCVGYDSLWVVMAAKKCAVPNYAWELCMQGTFPVLTIEKYKWDEVEHELFDLGYVARVIDAPATEQQAEAA